MTTNREYRKEKGRLRPYGAILNDMNAKLSYIIQLLREERAPCHGPSPPRNRDESEPA